MTKTALLTVATGILALMAPAIAQAQTDGARQDEAATEAGSNTIIVTARKREESRGKSATPLLIPKNRAALPKHTDSPQHSCR